MQRPGMINGIMLEVGTEVPELQVGPLTLVDLVRWAAYQENWIRIHYDRDYARGQHGISECVQSGHHRVALIARMLTDWLGQFGWIKRVAVRHTAPVYLGDTLRCGGRIRAVARERWNVELEVWAVRQDGRYASEGMALVEAVFSDLAQAKVAPDRS